MVSSQYPPYQSGLSDYTYYFAKHLKSQRDCFVLTSIKSEVEEDSIIRKEIDWSGFDLLKIGKTASEVNASDILIEYVPYMYGKRGINLIFPLYIFFLSLFSSRKIHTYFHEINYPFRWTIKTFILFILHKYQAFFLARASTKVFSSCLRFQRELKRFTFKKVIHLPIGSNISISQTTKEEIISKYRIDDKPKAIIFGGFHESKCFEWIYEACYKADIGLIHLGFSKDRVPEDLKQFVTDKFIFTSFLDDHEVSGFLKLGYPLLCPFTDGASTRRGTLIAGLNHGARVLSTKTKDTEPIFNSFVNLTLLENTTRNDIINFTKNNRDYFLSKPLIPVENSYFSWERIIKEFLREFN